VVVQDCSHHQLQMHEHSGRSWQINHLECTPVLRDRKHCGLHQSVLIAAEQKRISSRAGTHPRNPSVEDTDDGICILLGKQRHGAMARR
jgi:hypothetical protein